MRKEDKKTKEEQPLTTKDAKLNNSGTQQDDHTQDQDVTAAQKAKRKKILIYAAVILLIIGVILAIVLPLTLKNDDNTPDNSDPFVNPEYNPSTFDNTTVNASAYNVEFLLKQTAPSTYTATSLRYTSTREFFKLKDSMNGQSYTPTDPSKIVNASNNYWADYIRFSVGVNNNNQAHIILRNNDTTDEAFAKQRVNEEMLPRPGYDREARLTQVGFNYTNSNDSAFDFSFKNIYTGETIVSTKNRKLLVTDLYSEIGFVLPNDRCFGLGQRNGKFRLQQGTYTMNAKGREGELPRDDNLGGKGGNHIHPFVLCQTQTSSEFFGMFFVSNAPQVFEVVKWDGFDQVVLNYITVGGPIEMYFFMRGTAQEIIGKYHNLIGKTTILPYYAMGLWQGSSAYKTYSQFTKVFDQYTANTQALEGLFIENYNQQPHWTYTLSSELSDLPTYVASMQESDYHFIFTNSYALANSTSYPWYQKSIDHSCLIDSSRIMYKGKQVTGILDNTTVQYIDVFHNGSSGFFYEALTSFNQTFQFDGILLEDIHVPNEINGEVNQTTTSSAEKLASYRRMLTRSESTVGTYKPYLINETKGSDISTYALPFIPDYDYSKYLDNNTISLNATQSGKNLTAHLFLHNGVSRRALQKTYQTLTNNTNSMTKRPLIFTEASWSGSGSNGAALITDIYRSWDNLKDLINQMFQMTLAGMANTMVDVCGSLGPMDEELCARWMQVASFMPLVRNYYNETYVSSNGSRLMTPGSEPYNFKNFDFQTAYGSAGSDRLRFARYIYSSIYYTRKYGGSVVKPLFFDFPSDDNCLNDVEKSFMVGEALKISPVFESGKKENDTYSVYFPEGVWIDLYEPSSVINNTGSGKSVDLKAHFTHTGVHLKGGKIIPYQNNDGGYTKTRDFEINQAMGFKVARDQQNQYAEGYVLIDDGISQNSFDTNQFTFWKLRYAEKSINFWVADGNFQYEPEGYSIHKLDFIDILNAEDLKDTDFACYMGLNLNPINLTYSYDDDAKILTLKPSFDNPEVRFKDIGFIKFGNSAKEPNFCDIQTSFAYAGSKNDTISNDTYWVFNISSKQNSSALDTLIVEIELLDDEGTLNVEFTTLSDFNGGKQSIYRVPTPDVYNKTAYKQKAVTAKLETYVTYTLDPFGYKIWNNYSEENLAWELDSSHLFFSQYFILDSGKFATHKESGFPLMGMGERAGSLFYKNENGGIHSRYTFDQANPVDDGLPPGKNFYGYQPFYVYRSYTGQWVGVYDASSYATDYIIYSDINDGKNTTQIHKITIGGTLNKFFFLGKKVDDIIKKYQMLVGNPTVPPLWAFGWQQCRFGWVTSKEWWSVYQAYDEFKIPLDTMWADIDYMDDYKIFTISNVSYPDLADKVKLIHQDNRTFVPIMDAGVAVRKNQNYKAYEDGLTNNVFVLKSDKSGPLTAGVWPGNAYFPDFFSEDTVKWWHNMFDYLSNNTEDGGLGLKFDGIWLDMNEATSFCNGYCDQSERPTNSLRNKPFYVPGWRDLEDNAMGVDGWHSSINRPEYDVHNLFPLMQVKATSTYLASKLYDNARPYVLSRSNYPGIGKYGHHWMGDNYSNEKYMALSVDGVYSYQLFGLPFMGSDICGFNENAGPELCTKWHQLGSLYPFSRNHNQNGNIDQEPFRFNTTVNDTTNLTYTDVMRTALYNRYHLLRYYYSAFHQISVYGGSFFKPLFFDENFQNDPYTYDENDIKNNILLGDALKASINTQTIDFTTNGTTDFYFPAYRWCQIIPRIDITRCWETSDGVTPKKQNLPSGIEDYYVHMRNGTVIPTQDAVGNKIKHTKDLEANVTTDLLIFPNTLEQNTTMKFENGVESENSLAIGYIYIDDGVTFNNISRFDISLQITASDHYTVSVTSAQLGTASGQLFEKIGNVTFLMASKSGLEKVYRAEVSSTGQFANITVPYYDSTQDTLTVNVSAQVGGDRSSFFDQPKIRLYTAN